MVRSIILLFASSLLFSLKSYAAPRSEQEARILAENFFKSIRTRSGSFSSSLKLIATSNNITPNKQTRNSFSQSPAWYLYTANRQGFVLISGDDRMKDILGYSQTAVVSDSLPENMKVWLSCYTEQAEHLSQNINDTKPKIFLAPTEYPESVSPLLGEINYGQDAPYNQLCPIIDDKVCPTGCSATAMASILKYWEYPTVGKGNISYTTSTHEIDWKFNFTEKSFDWDYILPTYSGNTLATSKQKEAVAYLMAACGAACEMDYGPKASGAYSINIMNGLVKYLRYNKFTTLEYRKAYTSSEWMNLIKEELSNDRPIIYSGNDAYFSGHSFVIDGYDSDNMVHVNWGWDGSYNGYFEILTLEPSGTGTGGGSGEGYAYGQNMIINLNPKPSTGKSSFSIGSLTIENGTALIKEIYNQGYNFDGEFAVIAEKENKQYKISQSFFPEELAPGYGYRNLSLSLSNLEDLTPGVYDVYVGSKISLVELQYSQCRGGEVNNTVYRLLVSEDKTYTWESKTENDILPEIAIYPNTGIYSSSYASFDVEIHNPRKESEFFGEIRITFVDPTNSDVAYTARCGQIILPPEADTCFTSTIYIGNIEGNYDIYPCLYSNNKLYPCGDAYNVDVQKVKITNKVSLYNGRLDKDTYYTNDIITFEGIAQTIPGQKGIFSGSLDAMLCSFDLSNTLVYKAVPLIVEENNYSSFTIQMSANGAPGEYWFILANPYDQENYLLTMLPITIKTPSGINQIESNSEKAELISIRDNKEIVFKMKERPQTACLYNTSGQIVIQGTPEPSGEVYIFDINRVNSGVYILQIQSENGHRYMLKIKK